MSDLAEFLLARIAEDEKWARRRRDEDFVKHRVSRRPHLAPDDAERVLARCASDLRIVGWHASGHECPRDDDSDLAGWFGSEEPPCPTLCALALPYAEHPDYRQDWRP